MMLTKSRPSVTAACTLRRLICGLQSHPRCCYTPGHLVLCLKDVSISGETWAHGAGRPSHGLPCDDSMTNRDMQALVQGCMDNTKVFIKGALVNGPTSIAYGCVAHLGTSFPTTCTGFLTKVLKAIFVLTTKPSVLVLAFASTPTAFTH